MHRFLITAFLTVVATGCTLEDDGASMDDAGDASEKTLRTRAKRVLAPLPAQAENAREPSTDELVELGRLLYHDPRLSKNQELACVSCHALDGFGVDTRPEAVERGTSFGHGGAFGDRNAPSVFNAALHVSQFWDGRARDVEDQAKGPVLNPVEMAMGDESEVLDVLASIPGYAPLFEAAFPEHETALSYDNVAIAMGSFERKLLTPAPLDAFLEGDDAALTAEQREGLAIFLDAGCAGCHGGATLGGQTYGKLGLVKPYETQDEGRYTQTLDKADKHVFKVPSLRNVKETGPYFHDGSIARLEEAVQIMAEHQTTRGKLSERELKRVVAFLGSLTGTLPEGLSEAPQLPESGPDTPAPVYD